jgi:hypothetical protein
MVMKQIVAVRGTLLGDMSYSGEEMAGLKGTRLTGDWKEQRGESVAKKNGKKKFADTI